MATTVGMPEMARETWASKLRCYYTLSKPEVNLLILMTTSAGYYLSSRGPVRILGLINTLIGTLLVASGTATLNQWMERVWDGQMRRTASRPLPSGRLSAIEALVFGVMLSITGGVYLFVTVNALSAALADVPGWFTTGSPLGAFPGAMPTLIGWAGASATIDRNAWLLFAILFLWQFPHFLAIALMYREDYSRAGYHMLPAFDEDSRFTRVEILSFAIVLVIVTMLPVGEHVSSLYLAGMGAAGAFLLYYVGKLFRSNSPRMASRLLHASVLYLPVVLGIMVAGKR